MENRLKEIRKAVGMSISELARKADTTRQTIHNIENGSIKNVSGLLMFRIADALERSERDIFFSKQVTHEEQKNLGA